LLLVGAIAGKETLIGKGYMYMAKFILLVFMLLGMFFQVLSCSNQTQFIASKEADVIIFHPSVWVNIDDIESYEQIAKELGVITKRVDYVFINKKESFLDKEGRRKIRVLIIPGGEVGYWFDPKKKDAVSCQGVDNILSFVESGGSVIALCHCGSYLFSTYAEWLNPLPPQAQRGEWYMKNYLRGHFDRVCGKYAFRGTISGPQESNQPYFKTRFLPINMNPENEIVREGKLPSVIYQIVSGGGSIIPDKGQPLDVVGWYANGTAAIGIVPFGQGRIILCNPHPNITGKRVEIWRTRYLEGDAKYMKYWGWTNEMIAQERKLVEKDRDPDGPGPDWALSKAMLSYAYGKASQ
jgi:glutamine amidotransferase-like uncharacterized protein